MTYIPVGGVARSGTTLLYGVLCSGRQTNPALFETHLQLEVAIKERKIVRGQHREADIGRLAADVARAYEPCLAAAEAVRDRLHFVSYRARRDGRRPCEACGPRSLGFRSGQRLAA